MYALILFAVPIRSGGTESRGEVVALSSFLRQTHAVFSSTRLVYKPFSDEIIVAKLVRPELQGATAEDED